MRLFGKTVDVLLEDSNLFEPSAVALQRVGDAKEALSHAQDELRREVEFLNSQAALEIRRVAPTLSVSLSRDGDCVIQYRGYANQLRLRADPTNGRFVCGDSPFERRFKRYHGHTLDLGPEVIGKAVADFFRQSYRSIR